jgi:hypothetical protein
VLQDIPGYPYHGLECMLCLEPTGACCVSVNTKSTEGESQSLLCEISGFYPSERVDSNFLGYDVV